MKTQIIAMGGGGFSDEPDNPLLDLYILNQANTTEPEVCFVPTASGDSERYALNFYNAFTKYECNPSVFSFFNPPTQDLEDFFLGKDIIYVGGGNTFNMMAIWKAWGADEIFRKAMHEGTVLAGLSAGAICWFEQGHTDSFSHELDSMNCLGFLKGSCSPHYNGEPNRKPSFHELMKKEKIKDGYGIEDGAAIHFIDGKIHKVVSSRKKSKAYSVHKENNQIIENELPMEYLKTANQPSYKLV